MFTASDAISSMNFAQHQSMVQGMMPSNVAAEHLAGGMMSRGAAIGSPMMSGAAGLLGLDPLSMGFKAGGAAYSSGMVGLAGAAGVGMGVAGVAGIAGIGMQYAGGQMMQGAQQQMQLNQGLRQNYNFMNAQGGMGFTTNQGNQIGGAIRSMSHEVGPGGEHHGFDELSRIATNLGRMGGAQNVRTVDDFKAKFKETLETLKKVSHDLGTSLEDAMKTIQSMKGTGIFKAADQVKMAGDMRSTAMAGGMAMSEVTGMASIGSQISRAIGGRGISGANAGVRTIGQIGSATSVGAINEEDIYNATGQHGAEGRQALGAAQLQQSARFMSSSKGRYFLASIAGKNGQLDQDSVDEWMSGGNMSTGRTAEMAHQNLGKVGRANFIRNEGKLRGEALGQFGGLAQSMALKQWMGSRGIDPSNMDDRAMLGFQRFTGMGGDEADLAIKQINHLPEIMQHQRDTQRSLGYADAQQRQRATTGLAGLQKDVDHWKEGVNSKLQGMGADMLASGSDMIEGMYNRSTGTYVEGEGAGVSDLLTEASHSTDPAAIRKKLRRTLGSSAHSRANSATLANGAAGKALRAARAGAGEKYKDLGKASKDAVMMATIGAVFDPNDPEGADRAINAFKENVPDDLRSQIKGSREEQIAKIQSLQEGAGVAGESTMAGVLAARRKSYGGASSGAYSEGDRLTQQADRMLGRTSKSDAERTSELGFGAKWLVGMAVTSMAPTSAMVQGKNYSLANTRDMVGGAVSRFQDRQSGKAARDNAIGGFLDNKDNMAMAADLYSDDKEDRDAARRGMQDKILALKKGTMKDGKLENGGDQASLEQMSAMVLAADPKYAQMMDDMNSGKGADPKVMAQFRSMTGVELTREHAYLGVRGGLEAVTEQQERNREAYRAKDQSNIEDDRTRLQASGSAVRDEKGDLQVVGHGKATALGEEVDKELTAITNMDSGDERTERLAKFNSGITSMSREERKKLAIHGAGNAAGDAASRSLAAEDRLLGRERKFNGNKGAAVEDMFGLDVSKDEAAALAKMKPGEKAKYLADKIGAKDPSKLEHALGNKNAAERAKELEDIKRGGLTAKGAKDLKEREEGKKDPNVSLLEKIRDSAKNQEKFLNAIMLSTAGAETKLAEINKKDAEGTK